MARQLRASAVWTIPVIRMRLSRVAGRSADRAEDHHRTGPPGECGPGWLADSLCHVMSARRPRRDVRLEDAAVAEGVDEDVVPPPRQDEHVAIALERTCGERVEDWLEAVGFGTEYLAVAARPPRQGSRRAVGRREPERD